jgi:hypothetical protein
MFRGGEIFFGRGARGFGRGASLFWYGGTDGRRCFGDSIGEEGGIYLYMLREDWEAVRHDSECSDR